MRGIRYRPPPDSPIHELCNPPLTDSLTGIRFIQDVGKAVVGDAYHDPGTGEVYLWTGVGWSHLGAMHLGP
jgi:hypothetical protein